MTRDRLRVCCSEYDYIYKVGGVRVPISLRTSYPPSPFEAEYMERLYTFLSS